MNKHLAFALLALGVVCLVMGVRSLQQQTPTPAPAPPPPNQVVSTPGSKIVTVDSTEAWVDTGVNLDGSVEVTYLSGTWKNEGGSPVCRAEGLGIIEAPYKTTIPDANLGALIGKVGSKIFLVGSHYTGSPGRGRLYLGMNENPGTNGDNTGALVVSIRTSTVR